MTSSATLMESGVRRPERDWAKFCRYRTVDGITETSFNAHLRRVNSVISNLPPIKTKKNLREIKFRVGLIYGHFNV